MPIFDGVGSTETLHVFIGSRLDDRRPGVTGTRAPGYEAKIVDMDVNEVPRGTVGRLAALRVVRFLKALPKTPTGKIQRFQLKSLR